jgi:urease accessory protein
MSWLLFQLTDSAFPTGGFAHSGGLEAAAQLGELDEAKGLREFVREALWQAGYGALPLVSAAHADPSRWAELDALCEAFVLGAVQNRASRTQGRAFLATCVRSFTEPALDELQRQGQAARLGLHYPPVVGVTLATLGIARIAAQRWFLFTTLRGLLSAAVRLGLSGPHAAQGLQRSLAPVLEEILLRCAELAPEQVAQTAPILDLLQSAHDRLYSRLFVS